MNQPKDCIVFPGRLPPKEICFVNAILDDHEGMAVVRTVDAQEGRMEFWIAPALVDQFNIFVEFIRREYQIPIELGDPISETTEFTDFPESI